MSDITVIVNPPTPMFNVAISPKTLLITTVGIQGPQGIQGIQGEVGPQGPDGEMFLNMDGGAPDSNYGGIDQIDGGEI